MFRVPLPKNTTEDTIREMKEWLLDDDGYVGDGDFYFVDEEVMTFKFYKIAFLTTEEDAVAFKLRFGL